VAVMLDELPKDCDRGTKCNAQGYKSSWNGSVTHSRSVLRFCLVARTASTPATMTPADFSLRQNRRPFRHKARSPQVRVAHLHRFIAQPPHLRRFALVTRASWFHAHSPCLAAPSLRFLFIGSRCMLHACLPRSVALTQLRFTPLTVTSSQRDLHPQVCAHPGRTQEKKPRHAAAFFLPRPMRPYLRRTSEPGRLFR
jgi:hypothetical protein